MTDPPPSLLPFTQDLSESMWAWYSIHITSSQRPSDPKLLYYRSFWNLPHQWNLFGIRALGNYLTGPLFKGAQTHLFFFSNLLLSSFEAKSVLNSHFQVMPSSLQCFLSSSDYKVGQNWRLPRETRLPCVTCKIKSNLLSTWDLLKGFPFLILWAPCSSMPAGPTELITQQGLETWILHKFLVLNYAIFTKR